MEKELYLDLLKKVLIDYHRIDKTEYQPLNYRNSDANSSILTMLDNLVGKKSLSICRRINQTHETRLEGQDWPLYADSMVGLKRLENIEFCANQVDQRPSNLPPDDN